MKTESISQLKKILSKTSLQQIIKKIDAFRSLDKRNISDEDLSREIINVTSNNDGISMFTTHIQTYSKDVDFFRVRLLPVDDYDIPLRTMSYEVDAWNPPVQNVTAAGRLNKVSESLLYVTPIIPDIAVKEMKVKHLDKICLIVYTSIREIKINNIGYWCKNPNLTDEENLKIELYNNFLKHEFSLDVGRGTEFLYRTSEMIAKHFFDLPPVAVQDAWAYPSVYNKSALNVCFRPDIAKVALKLKTVMICNVHMDTEQISYEPLVLTDYLDKNQLCTWYRPDSDIFKSIIKTIFV